MTMNDQTEEAASSDGLPHDAHVPNGPGKSLDRVDAGDPAEGEKVDDVPPEGGYGWICLIAVMVINAHTWGINATYGVFLNYYLSSNFFPNTSYITYAFVGGLSISQAVLIAPLATYVVNKLGTRICLHIGIFFETLSLIGVSFATQKYQLVLAQGFCFGFGMGFLFVGSVGIIPQWFLRKRSLANALAAAGSGAGGLIYSLATQRIIETLGLPWAFRILGLVSMVANLVASNLVRDRNKAVGSRTVPFDYKLLKRPEFVLFQGFAILSLIGYCVVLFSLPDFATSIGLSPKQGSIVGATLNAGQMIGRPFIGLASDKWGRLNIATLFTFLCGLFCIAFWIPAREIGLLIFFSMVGGALAGTFWSAAAPLTAEIVGLRDLPAALSVTWVIIALPTTCAEAIGLELRKHKGNIYINAQIFTAMMYIGGSLCLWFVRAWKVGELEELARLEGRSRTGLGLSGKESDTINEGAPPESQGEDVRSIAAKNGSKSRDLFRRLVAVKHV